MKEQALALLHRSTVSLTLGSVMLLLGAFLFWFALRGSLLLLAFVYPATIIALFLHVRAWVRLGQGVFYKPAEEATVPSRRLRWEKGAFGASLVGFVAGLVSLPWTLPNQATWLGPLWVWAIVLFAFPYVPTVFAPVVFAHSSIFIFVAGRSPGGRAFIMAGVVFLIVIASSGLVVQLLFLPGAVAVLPLFGGLTAIGYGVVARGLHLTLTRGPGTEPSMAAAETF